MRTPELVLGDFQAQVAAIHFGEAELLKMVRKYGVEGFKNGMQELLDYTERLTSQAIRALPDGSWSFTDYLDNDGITQDPIAVRASLTKKDDELFVDFTGTSPQSKGSIQGMFSTNKGMVYIVVKSLLGLDIPNTSGLLRPITITAPEGSFGNPLLPAAVASRSIGCRMINHALWGAFAQMVPERVFGCPGGSLAPVYLSGYDRSTTPWNGWILLDAGIGVEVAMGARHDKDGIDAQCTNVTQYANIPAEIIDAEFPIIIEEHALVPDSEGPGKFRGGLGLVRQWRCKLDETQIQITTDRSKRPPWGVAGGGSGQPHKVTMNPGERETLLPQKCMDMINRGDVLRVQVSGAGGFGDRLERAPERVLWDVIEEKVSPQRAREVYGVVVDMEGRTIDWEATRRLRQEMRHSVATHSQG